MIETIILSTENLALYAKSKGVDLAKAACMFNRETYQANCGSPRPKTVTVYTIYQYIPAFVEVGDNYKPTKNTFKNEGEFDECSLVKSWKTRFETLEFYKFSVDTSIGRNGGTYRYLMAEFDNGKTWYVVGAMLGHPPWLSEWEPNRG